MIRQQVSGKKGFSLTLLAVFIAIVVAILIPSICASVFFTSNMIRVDMLRQQAYYYANSGVEYARFILDRPLAYDPLNATTATGKTAWPGDGLLLQPPPDSKVTFQCLQNDDPFDPESDPYIEPGTVTVTIETGPGGVGYNITSTGTVQNITSTIRVHWAGGKIDQWQ